jgi:hypothetical protein
MRERGVPNPYRDRVKTVGLSASCTPTRSQSLEPLRTNIREKRWRRDIDAYKRLHGQGYRPPRIDGSAFRERAGQTEHDINERPVTIDYNDPS